MQKEIHHDGGLPYLLYHPAKADQPAPLILFLHGSGERGTNPVAIEKYCLPKFLSAGMEIPFRVYAPQCPAETRWIEIEEQVMAGLAAMIQQYHPPQIYLTGFSMGGQGACSLAVHYPQHFAAVAPVAGVIPPAADFLEKLCVLKDHPLWVFHGTADTFVPVENSDRMVATLRECGATRLTYTRYENAQHGEASDQTYGNPDLYQWFLAQLTHSAH